MYKCWSCGNILDYSHAFCEHCKALQPQDNKTLFELFQIHPSYCLDESQLQTRYLNLQIQFHPDKFIQKSEKEKLIAQTLTSRINEGFEILKSPLKRCQYLYKLHTGKDILSGDMTISDPEILMEMMEDRESIEEISDKTDWDHLFQSQLQKYKSCQKTVADDFQCENWLDIEKQIYRLKYIEKTICELKQKRHSFS